CLCLHYMCILVCVCGCVCVCVCLVVCLFGCLCVFVHLCVCLYVSVRTLTALSDAFGEAARWCVCMCVCACVCVCVCLCVCVKPRAGADYRHMWSYGRGTSVALGDWLEVRRVTH